MIRNRIVCVSLFGAALSGVGIPVVAQTTSVVSVNAGGTVDLLPSSTPSISSDGRFVAFVSFNALDPVPQDQNNRLDVFVHDQQTGATERVSINSAGFGANDASFSPSVSSDGRFVAFGSIAVNLGGNDTNGVQDIFVHDRQTGMTERISIDSAGAEANGESARPSISADGRFVAFRSDATNLVAGDANGLRDVFVHDRQSDTTQRVSVDSAGVEGNGSCGNPSISADGRFVAFGSFATDLVAGDTNSAGDVFVHDRQSGATERVSVDSAGVQGNATSHDDVSATSTPTISSDGRFVAFASSATNLVPSDTNGVRDVFARDRQAGATQRVSVDSAGAQGNAAVEFDASISPDGRFVAFSSVANNMVPGDTNVREDVFVHDRQTGATQRVSVDSAGIQGDRTSRDPSISSNGEFVAFESDSRNLDPVDTNNVNDIFVRDPRHIAACRAGTVNGGSGPVTDVLMLNGGTGIVSASTGAPIEFQLDAAPNGPGGPGNSLARYVLWIWLGFPANAFDLSAGGSALGCTVNPTPFHPAAAPQAFRCLRGTGLPNAVCRGVSERTAPARAPWTIRRNQGFAHPFVLTLQGVLEDAGAANPSGFSVTNAVSLVVQ